MNVQSNRKKRIVNSNKHSGALQDEVNIVKNMRCWFCPKCFQKVASSSDHSSPIIPAHTRTHSNLGYHQVLSATSEAYISPINQVRCPRKLYSLTSPPLTTDSSELKYQCSGLEGNALSPRRIKKATSP